MNIRYISSLAATLSVLGILAACGTAKTPSSVNLSAAQTKYPGYSMADFTAGQALYAENCGRCHPAYAPASHTEEQWAKWVPKMVPKANKKAGTVAIDDAGQDLIIKFLYAASH
jgi:mono/diheme cytochrome c family protein